MDKLLNPFPSQCSAALQPLLSEKNHMQSQHLQARAHLHFPGGRKKKKNLRRDSLFAAAAGKSHETSFPEGKYAFRTLGIMGAVVKLYTEQKVPVSHFFLSYVNTVFVTACKLELRVLERTAM